MAHRIVLGETALASRNAAADVRSGLESLLEEGGPVVIDLSTVQSVSSSFADELFAVLAEDLTLPRFAERVCLVGANAAVLREIASAIHYRLSPQTDIAVELLAAQKAKNERRRQVVA